MSDSTPSVGWTAGVSDLLEDAIHAHVAREASAVLRALGRSEQIDPRDLSPSLGVGLEHLLCQCLEGDAVGRSFWVDGVLIDDVRVLNDGNLQVHGDAWCAEGESQWLAPTRATIEIGGTTVHRLQACKLEMGDARTSSLRDQSGGHVPDEWLFVFELQNPADKLEDVIGSYVQQVRQWERRNPGGRIVGSDWQPITVDECRSYIRELVVAREAPKLEETPLDGVLTLWVGGRQSWNP